MTFDLPPSATPRPGEEVVAYTSNTKFEGKFYGYNAVDELLISNGAGGILNVDDYRKVRLLKPLDRKPGCWAELPINGIVVKATDEERGKLSHLLAERIAPGPMYIDFIYEIWARGFEVFLVGGSVRDVLAGNEANDVDLVTSMPFFLLEPLAEAIFGHRGYSRSKNNGFMSVGFGAAGGKKGEGTTIDVKNFFQFAPGTPNAQFGSDLGIDHSLRDFSCNAIYYDPVNAIFVDPCGHGIEDAKAQLLNLINDTSMEHPTYRKGVIALRFFKFVLRGYKPTEGCIQRLNAEFKPLFMAMGTTQAEMLLRRQILSKVPEESRLDVLLEVKQIMHSYGYQDIWETYYSSLESSFGT